MTATQTSLPTAESARAALPAAAAWIDGDWYFDTTGGSHTHIDPASGTELGTWKLPSADDIDRAVASTARAQCSWIDHSPKGRRDLLFALGRQIDKHTDTLASLVTLEMGMPYRASLAAAKAAGDWFKHYAGYADKIEGSVPSVLPGGEGLDYTRRVPYGVVGAIIPWNGPIIALALKVAPALAAGNGVVLKPSELAPFSSLYFASLVSAAGLPPGLLNVVPGGPEIGAALCSHPDVALISFTGGGIAGQKVSETAAKRHVPTVLELGGKSASLIFADSDIATAAKLAAVLGTAQNCGQGCFLPTRLLVERSAYDEVVESIIATVKGFRLGDPFDPSVTMGPVVNEQARERILSVIYGACRRGDGRLVTGGGCPGDELSGGSYIQPTVFVDVHPDSPLGQDEVFGPVLSVIPFDTEAEAIAIANNSRFGLAGYVWTRDLGRAHRVADALEAGYVSVNSLAALPPEAPFGGWKESGRGVEGGPEGLGEFLRTKNVHVKW